MNIAELRLNEDNPRHIGEEEFEKLRESIERDPEFMQLRPIVIDEQNIVRGGNQRFKALMYLGYEDIPEEWVVKAENLTQEQLRRFVLVDNQTPEMAGEWDFKKLAEQMDFSELDDLGFAVDESLLSLEGVKDESLPLENKSLEAVEAEKSKYRCPWCGFEW